jgi:hypothetical protein
MPRSNPLFRLAILLTGIAVIGCSSDSSNSTSPESLDVTGTWILRTVDGLSVDAAPPSDDSAFFVRIHEQVTIAAGGAYQDSVHDDFIDTTTGALVDSVTTMITGTWTYDGATTLHLVHDDVDEPGIVSRDTLKIGTSVFTRP